MISAAHALLLIAALQSATTHRSLSSSQLPVGNPDLHLLVSRARRCGGWALRGGGGVMEGQLTSAPGLGAVSDLLKARGALGGTCGDPPNVPPDITSNSHLDMLAPASLWKMVGTPEADVENADIEVKEWRDQVPPAPHASAPGVPTSTPPPLSRFLRPHPLTTPRPHLFSHPIPKPAGPHPHPHPTSSLNPNMCNHTRRARPS